MGGAWPIGVSADYSGYPNLNTPYSAPGTMNLPPTMQGQPPPQARGGQPNHYPPFGGPTSAPMAPPTNWGQPMQGWGYVTPAPNAYQPLGGPPVGPPAGWPNMGMESMTAAMAGMGLGGQGGYQAFGTNAPPQRRQRYVEEGDRMDPFAEGEHCAFLSLYLSCNLPIESNGFPNYLDGPVLTPMIVSIVEAKLRMNPILLPPSHPDSKAHLTWNLLCPTSDIHYSTDPVHKSWSTGRHSPATFPRTNQLIIITTVNTWQWYIPVNAHNPKVGVTCTEIVDAVEKSMRRMTVKKDWNAIPTRELQNEVAQSYKRNRGRGEGLSFKVPGGNLGDGMVRMDFLRDYIYWGGLEVIDTDQPDTEGDHQHIMRRWLDLNARSPVVGWPCTLVLRLESVRSRTADEFASEWERSRHRRAGSAAGRPRSASRGKHQGQSQGPWGGGLATSSGPWGGGMASSSGQRSRAGSRAATSRPGSRVGIRVQGASSDEESDSSD